MDMLEIGLLIIGGVIFILSFVLPKKKEELDEDTKKLAGEQIRDILDKEIAGVQSKIEDVVSETIEESSSETERALEKMTNEKIMAINEYSDTVIDDINKNHKEVLFLYDMLNDKHVTIRNTVTEVEKTVGEVTQTAKDIEISAKETAKDLKSSEEAVKRATDITNRAEKAAELTAQNIELDVRRIVEDMIRGRVEETLEKTAAPMIQEKVDEILSDASVYMDMEKQPKIVVDNEIEKQMAETVESDTTLTGQVAEEKESNAVDAQPEADFVQGITAKAPKIVLENENDENPQYYVLEPQEDILEKTEMEMVDLDDSSSVKEEEKENRNSNEKILSLHKAGMSNVAIAKELGLGVGEVKLVIDLFEGMSR